MRFAARKALLARSPERCAAPEALVGQRMTLTVDDEIKDDEYRRRLRRELLFAARRWLDSLQKGVK